MEEQDLIIKMLDMKDVLQTNQGLIEVPSYNGDKREALKNKLFGLSGVKVEDINKSKDNEPIKVEQEDV